MPEFLSNDIGVQLVAVDQSSPWHLPCSLVHYSQIIKDYTIHVCYTYSSNMFNTEGILEPAHEIMVLVT